MHSDLKNFDFQTYIYFYELPSLNCPQQMPYITNLSYRAPVCGTSNSTFSSRNRNFPAAGIKSIKFLERLGRQRKRIAAADDYEKNYIFACRRDLHVGLRMYVCIVVVVAWHMQRDGRSITKGDWGYKKKSQERVTCKLGAMWKIVFPIVWCWRKRKQGKLKTFVTGTQEHTIQKHTHTHTYTRKVA